MMCYNAFELLFYILCCQEKESTIGADEILIAPSQTKQENEADERDAEAPLPAGTRNSLIVLGMIGLVDAIEYAMIMPSLSKYLTEIQGTTDTQTYGLVLALFSISSMSVKPFIGNWCDRRDFREVYASTIFIAICGAICYALARWQGSIAMIIVGRLLGGVGAANTSLLYAYVSRAVPPQKQTMVMMATGMTFPVGMVLGPATNFLTAWVGLQRLGHLVQVP